MKTLTQNLLHEVKNGAIIARGESNNINPLDLRRVCKWIAFKNFEGKWEIRYGQIYTPDSIIMTIGLPLICVDRIKQLVDCDGDALWMYASNPYWDEPSNKSGIIQEIYDALVSEHGRDKADEIYLSCKRDAYEHGHPLHLILKGEFNLTQNA